MATRVKEHQTRDSAIKTHISTCNACQQSYSCANNFSILDKGKNDFEITIKEALYIKSNRPRLNKQLSTNGISFLLNLF